MTGQEAACGGASCDMTDVVDHVAVMSGPTDDEDAGTKDEEGGTGGEEGNEGDRGADIDYDSERTETAVPCCRHI